jgi:hypothetical protein
MNFLLLLCKCSLSTLINAFDYKRITSIEIIFTYCIYTTFVRIGINYITIILNTKTVI